MLLVLALVFMCILVMKKQSNARKEAQKIRDFVKYQKTVIEKKKKITIKKISSTRNLYFKWQERTILEINF